MIRTVHKWGYVFVVTEKYANSTEKNSMVLLYRTVNRLGWGLSNRASCMQAEPKWVKALGEPTLTMPKSSHCGLKTKVTLWPKAYDIVRSDPFRPHYFKMHHGCYWRKHSYKHLHTERAFSMWDIITNAKSGPGPEEIKVCF